MPERLFGIEIREEQTKKYPVYHEDVKVFTRCSTKGAADVIGLLYADYYARPGAKRGGAWMGGFRSRSVGKVQIPLIINNCNFAKPTPEEPTFLSLLEVETMFHEFGHALHGLLSQAQYVSQSGAEREVGLCRIAFAGTGKLGQRKRSIPLGGITKQASLSLPRLSKPFRICVISMSAGRACVKPFLVCSTWPITPKASIMSSAEQSGGQRGRPRHAYPA